MARGYRAAAQELKPYAGAQRSGGPIDDLAGFTGWALLTMHGNLAHWITRVDQELGPGKNLRNIAGAGFHTACGLSFGLDILHDAGNWRRCIRCKRAVEREARERAAADRRKPAV